MEHKQNREVISCLETKRPLFWVTHHPVQKQSPDSLVKKLINSLTLFCSSTGKLECQRCCEQQREYMMSDKTERSERERTGILSTSPQCRAFKRGIWISLIIHILCPALQLVGGSKFKRERPGIADIVTEITLTFSLPLWGVH